MTTQRITPVAVNSNGRMLPVRTGTAPGLEDGLYLVRRRQTGGPGYGPVPEYVAIVAETVVGRTMLHCASFLDDFAAAVEVPGRRLIGEPEPGGKEITGIYLIPGSAYRAVQMGKTYGYEFTAQAEG